MYNSVFYTGNSTEAIFELNFDKDGKMNGATANLYGNTTKGKSAHFEPTAQLFNTYLDVQYDYRARDFIAATVEAVPTALSCRPRASRYSSTRGSRRHWPWCRIRRMNIVIVLLPARPTGYSTVCRIFT